MSTTASDKASDWCECCAQFCSDADRDKFKNRFSTFAQRREKEWAELEASSTPLPPGVFAFLKLPRELRDTIYALLLGPKTGVEKYVTHDHIFPTQILYLNNQIREEFMQVLFDRIWAMAQYSTSPKHVELTIPPASALHRVKQLWVRLIVSNMHGEAIPTWTQVLLDAKLFLSLFPNLRHAHVVCRGVYGEERMLDEVDVGRAWRESGVGECEAVWRVEFELEGPRGEVLRRRRVDGYVYKRASGSERAEGKWVEEKSSRTVR